MNYIENKIITIQGKDYEIKSYLTFAETQILVKQSTLAYLEGSQALKDNLEIVEGNKMTSDFVFNSILVALVSEELSDIDYDILHSAGVFDLVMEEVVGAKQAKKYVEDAIRERNSFEYKFSEAMNKIVAKLPDSKELNKLSKSIIKDLTNPKNKDAFERLKDLIDFKKEEIL